MTVYSHDTRVETLAVRPCVDADGRNAFGNRDTMAKVTQSDGSTEYLVYFSGRDPLCFSTEADARARFEPVEA